MTSILPAVARALRHGGCLATRACRGDLQEQFARQYTSKVPNEQVVRQLENLQRQIKIICDGKINFHTKQRERNAQTLRKHQELRKADKNPTVQDVHIKDKADAIRAHEDVLKTLKSLKKDLP